MAKPLELEGTHTRLTLLPSEGAAVGALEALTADGPVPLLAADGPGDGAVFRSGLQLLAPFSNRISNGGFPFGGAFHTVTPNVPGEPFPIHGDAFERPFDIAAMDDRSARLTMHNGAIGPWRYRADITYSLGERTVKAEFSITNTGVPLPFGAGFHPWLVREPDARLALQATAVWLETDDHLPDRKVPLSEASRFDFREARAPSGWINNAYTDWDGGAKLIRPAAELAVSLTASPSTVIVYTNAADAPFVCIEPVSHPVDAHNLPGQPGLQTLNTGEAMTLTMELTWRPL